MAKKNIEKTFVDLVARYMVNDYWMNDEWDNWESSYLDELDDDTVIAIDDANLNSAKIVKKLLAMPKVKAEIERALDEMVDGLLTDGGGSCLQTPISIQAEDIRYNRRMDQEEEEERLRVDQALLREEEEMIAEEKALKAAEKAAEKKRAVKKSKLDKTLTPAQKKMIKELYGTD